MDTGNYKYIATATTTVCQATPCILRRLIITEPVASTIIVYDNATGAGDIVASFVASAPAGTYEFNVPCRNGLTVITAGASKLTVVFE